jgi:hypothetical protein
MDTSLLKYTDAQVTVCLHDMTRQDMHNVIRSVAIHPTRIRVCACVADHWIRSSLSFLHVVWIPIGEQCKGLGKSNQPSLPAAQSLFNQHLGSSASSSYSQSSEGLAGSSKSSMN